MAIDGFLTRSVRDTAALIDATHGAPTWVPPYYAPPLTGRCLDAHRHGTPATFGSRSRHCPSPVILCAPRTCRAAIEHTASLCAAAGHEMVEADPQVEIDRFMRRGPTSSPAAPS
jgi:Asp-tRNA(Asn)/Glu-tRNA(Gln) amidotransferase A subunit family amidase